MNQFKYEFVPPFEADDMTITTTTEVLPFNGETEVTLFEGTDKKTGEFRQVWKYLEVDEEFGRVSEGGGEGDCGWSEDVLGLDRVPVEVRRAAAIFWLKCRGRDVSGYENGTKELHVPDPSEFRNLFGPVFSAQELLANGLRYAPIPSGYEDLRRACAPAVTQPHGVAGSAPKE